MGSQLQVNDLLTRSVPRDDRFALGSVGNALRCSYPTLVVIRG